MANQLDLEEQEQLDQLRHFWKQYGNPITWVLIAILSSVAAWNGYQFWQRNQSVQAAALFDEVERVVRSGDISKADRAFAEMKERFASTIYTQQAGLMLAKMAFDAGNADVTRSALTWVADSATDAGYASVAKLRLASVLMDAKAFDDALKVLDSVVGNEFKPLRADRRGDIYVLQGRKSEAKVEYEIAQKALDEQSDYRKLVEVKLGALGGVVSSSGVAVASEGPK
jgi:predicted negative regulator of RcsB-dependent stress response